MNKILNEIRDEIKKVPFIMLNDHHVSKIQHFVRTPTLSKLFILYNFPKGKSYFQLVLTVDQKLCHFFNKTTPKVGTEKQQN